MKRQNCKLKSTRKERGMNQTELAGRANVSVSYLGALETGWIVPSRKIQAKIADVLGCKPETIFNAKGEK